MENHSQMTRTRRDWLLILLLTLVPLTCAWAFLPSRHEVGPSAAAEFALATHLVDPTDTTDTTTSQSPATPQVIGYIDKDPSIPGIPIDSLYPKPPRDSIPFKPLDRRGPVGTPSGIVSVSATGAATYNLDIQVPDGGGLTPHLSLTYDSQKGGYGLAGYGIGITGLSAITRGGCDLFHDGAQRGVTYTDADNLFLDGKRLVLLSGIRGRDGATYTVEGDPYTSVTTHGGDEWFTVATPSGMTYEYGRTIGSRLAYTDRRGAQHVASWHVTKGRDSHANTITYTYALSGLSIRPTSITYGTNEAKARGITCKVAFAYRSLGDNTRPFTLGDQRGRTDFSLSTITTSCNDSVYRTYMLTYDDALDQTSGKWTRLAKVEEANGRGEKYPPVKLTWKPLPAFSPVATTLKVQTEDIDRAVIETGKCFLATDLNGDGVSDIIRVSSAQVPNTDKGGRTLYTRVYVSRSHMQPTGEIVYDNMPVICTLPPCFSYHGIKCLLSGASVMDFDGDGYNDLFFAFGSTEKGKGGGDNWSNTVLYVIKGSDVAKSRNCEPEGQFIQLDSVNTEPLFATLDLNGDGKDEILCIWPRPSDGRYPCAIVKHLDDRLRDVTLTKLTLPTGVKKDIAKVFTGDYNNDGLTDLILLYDGGYKIYFNKGGDAIPNRFGEDRVAEGTTIGDSWRMEQGDIDGDGLTDFILNRRGERTLRIARNNGDGTFTLSQTADLGVGDHASLKDDDHFSIHILDLDHDGRSDAIVCKATYVHHGFPKFNNEYTGTKVMWLLSDGTTLKTARTLTKTREDDALENTLFTGDFNGDGSLELANYGTRLTDTDDKTADKVHYYRTGGDLSAAGHLTGVTDGLGATTTIRYAFATSPTVYTRSTGGAYPVNTYTLPIPVVAGTTRPGGAAGYQETRYRYQDLRIHVAGRGALGFGAVTADNTTLGTSETCRADQWDETLWIPTRTTATTTVREATSTVASQYTVAHTGGTHFAYISHKDVTDLDGNTATTDTRYDTAKGVVTEETVYNGGDNMYKRVAYDDYQRKGGMWLPGRMTLTQKHADNAAPHTSVTTYQYDDRGDAIAITVNSGTDLALTTTNTHDAYGNTLTSVTTGRGVKPVTHRHEYDPTGRFVIRATTNPASTVTAYTRDLWGNALTERDETDPSRPLTTRHTYDGWGRRLTTVRPDGTQTARETNWSFRGDRYCEKVTSTGQPPVTTWYDIVGHELSRETVGPKGLKLTTTTDYNTQGRISRVTDKRGKLTITTDYTYDDRGRLAQAVSSTGQSVTHAYNGRTETTTLAGRTYAKTYDAWGNLVRSDDPAGVTRYRYASVGKPRRMSALGAVTKMAYDEAGNRLTLSDPDAGTTRSTYAADGTPLTETDARGVVTAHTYDDLGRLVSSQVGGTIVTRTYGTVGNERLRLVKETAGGNTVEYTHDALGRVVTEKRHVDGDGDYTFAYAYNEKGQVAKVTFPGGLVETYEYDGNGHKVQTAVGDRVVCRLDSVDGLRSRTTLLGRLCLVQTNDSRGFERQRELHRGQTVLESITLEHDGATGNLLSRQRGGGATESFSYDDLDRLTSVKQDGRETLSVTYAPNGNIRSKTGVGAFTYDTATRPHAVTEVENADGQIPTSDLLTTFGDLNKIETVEDTERGLRQEFSYGPDEQRWLSVMISGGKETRRTVYADAYEKVTEGGRTREYYYLDGNTIAIRENGAIKYYAAFTDQQGNILSVVDENGGRVFDATYDAWGRQTVTLNTIGLRRGYTGHEMMGEFGLINMNGRVYDPTLGRFLSPDNYVQAPDNSQSFNRYSYCLNNPLKYTDPSGEFWNLIIGAAIGGIFNWASHGFQLNAKGLGYFATGAVAGAVGAGLASGVNVAMAGGNFWTGAAGLAKGIASTGFLAGAASGASAGFAGGFISGAGNSWVGGSSFGKGLLAGLGSGGLGTLEGGIAGGLIGGLDALDKGTSFWTGNTSIEITGAYACPNCNSSGFNLNEKTVTGKYVGEFEGVNVFETKNLGSLVTPESDGYYHYRAVTVPERGIIAGEGVFTSGLRAGQAMMQHEFGHILQYRMFGPAAYWHVIAPESFANATFFPSSHHKYWTETWANYLAKGHFRGLWIGGVDYPIKNISTFNWWKMKLAQMQGMMMAKPRGFI